MSRYFPGRSPKTAVTLLFASPWLHEISQPFKKLVLSLGKSHTDGLHIQLNIFMAKEAVFEAALVLCKNMKNPSGFILGAPCA
jgi:hypothetical protein